MKTCSKCKITKLKSEFSKQSCKPDGLRYHCKQCRKDHQQKFYKKNKTKILAKNKEYYNVNKDEIQAKNRIYYNNKYKEDINFRLARTLRSRLNCAIKANQKVGSAVSDLGCSIEELKKHLENQFQEGMSWDNYGEWHIDHIKPLANFDLTNESEFKEACNYNNLQPLWAEDNLRKNKY